MWHWRGALISTSGAIKDKSKASVVLGGPLEAPFDQESLGVSAFGFKGFQPRCSAYFQESFTGVAIFVVNRNAGDARERWAKDVRPEQVNGSTWLKGIYGPSDYPAGTSKYGLSPRAEIHILPIPETDSGSYLSSMRANVFRSTSGLRLTMRAQICFIRSSSLWHWQKFHPW